MIKILAYEDDGDHVLVHVTGEDCELSDEEVVEKLADIIAKEVNNAKEGKVN